ncbi:MAG: FAD-dependent monooxygenase [Cytophagales bacterium]|nr:FAD-dependent monooxygenase [Cytophagales bacterium]
MNKELNLVVPPEIGLDEEQLSNYLQKKIKGFDPLHFKVLKKSIDARKRQIKINLKIEVSDKPFDHSLNFEGHYPDVTSATTMIIIGAGPAGLFAALRLIELGVKPIVLERGKDVRARRRDLAAINKEHIVNPDSNYCFGEGGAGTYSDGKLYTRSKKRGDVNRILEILVAHGATDQILVDAHPHIGTNKLPAVVAALRESILKAGGEIHFNAKVTDLLIHNEEIKGVKTEDCRQFEGESVILATGHSARDIFYLLHDKGIAIENKSFAMGVRIEHQQAFVDSCQYHTDDRGLLPAAAYSLVAQTKYKGVQRGVFSFCMCPGGFIVPASTAPGELVVNGMSPSRRDSRFANSGVVVAMNEPDWAAFESHGPLAALELQKSIEQKVWSKTLEKYNKKLPEAENKLRNSQLAPAQRIPDFLNGGESKELNDTSYQPGLVSLDMSTVLPDFIAEPLKDGIRQFGKKMKGYVSNGGQLIGLESRTSSPVRVPRDKETLEHISTKRLFPCGEGAGYAGGIISAAVDGEKCAEAAVNLYAKKSKS